MLDKNITYALVGVLVVVVLAYYFFSTKKDEKFSVIPTGFFADANTDDYVLIDNQGNFKSSNLLNVNKTNSNNVFNVLGSSSVTGDLRTNNNILVGNKRVITANIFAGFTSTLTTGVNWITVDNLFRIKYSTGVSGSEIASINIIPVVTAKPISAVGFIVSNPSTNTNRSAANEFGITWGLNPTTSPIPTSPSTVYALSAITRDIAGTVHDFLVNCGTSLVTGVVAPPTQTYNSYRIYCQLQKTFIVNSTSAVADGVVFVIEKIFPVNEILNITI